MTSLTFIPETLGRLIADRWLVVPPYQREYAWEIDNVEDFWNDLNDAMVEGRQYFVGAIVLTALENQRHHIIDGQQRLATTSLLLAAIRDELAAIGEDEVSEHVESSYLRSFNRHDNGLATRLRSL